MPCCYRFLDSRGDARQIRLTRVKLESEFDKFMAAQPASRSGTSSSARRAGDGSGAHADTAAAAAEHMEEGQAGDAFGAAPFAGHRHCWVLVRKGQRDVAEDFFIEPSTGEALVCRTLSDATRYISIDSMWNSVNYFVNMQNASNMADVRFMVYDTRWWEHVFVPSMMEQPQVRQSESNEDAPNEDVDPAVLEARALDAQEKGKIYEVPPSWTKPFNIEKPEYRTRFPGGVLEEQLHCATITKYDAGLRSDGLVEKFVLFADAEKEMVTRTTEVFAGRRDHLIQRETLHVSDTSICTWSSARKDGLARLVLEPEQRTVEFGRMARADGLIARVDIATKQRFQSREKFCLRTDRLVERIVTYAKPGMRPKQKFQFEGVPVRKITLVFGREEREAHQKQCSRIVFAVGDETVRVEYHPMNDYVTSEVKTFVKGDKMQIVLVDPFDVPPSPRASLTEYQELASKQSAETAENERMAGEIGELVRSALADSANPSQVRPMLHVRGDAGPGAADARAAGGDARRERDYLAPFIAAEHPINPERLTRNEATRVRDNALDAFRERLLARSHIIQARLQQETDELVRMQATYQRDRETMSREEEEHYMLFCNQAMFRIQVLEKRLREHTNNALKRYAVLSERIKGDQRLAAIFIGGGGGADGLSGLESARSNLNSFRSNTSRANSSRLSVGTQKSGGSRS